MVPGTTALGCYARAFSTSGTRAARLSKPFLTASVSARPSCANAMTDCAQAVLRWSSARVRSRSSRVSAAVALSLRLASRKGLSGSSGVVMPSRAISNRRYVSVSRSCDAASKSMTTDRCHCLRERLCAKRPANTSLTVIATNVAADPRTAEPQSITFLLSPRYLICGHR
jgi:hypothetical protein